MNETKATFDVIAVELGSGRVTVVRKGDVDEWHWERPESRFYTTAEAGKYRTGDTYGAAR